MGQSAISNQLSAISYQLSAGIGLDYSLLRSGKIGFSFYTQALIIVACSAADYCLLLTVCCLLFAAYCYCLMPSNIYIGLGSNLGDRAGNLLLAIRGVIDSGLEVTRLSRIFETEPFETVAQPSYLNMVAEVRTRDPLTPEETMARLLQVESSLGRTREVEGGPRTIDLDLLLFGDEVRDSELLKLPHPRLHRRRFVLAPLVELAPYVVHPALELSLKNILESLEDQSGVKLWRP